MNSYFLLYLKYKDTLKYIATIFKHRKVKKLRELFKKLKLFIPNASDCPLILTSANYLNIRLPYLFLLLFLLFTLIQNPCYLFYMCRLCALIDLN